MDKLPLIRAMLRNNEIKAVVFDLDGTLYSSKAGLEFQIKPQMCAQTANQLGVSEAEARQLLARYRDEFRSSVLGLREYHGINPADFLNAVYGNLDRSVIVPYLGLADQIKSLSQLCSIYLLTNSNRLHALDVLSRIGLTDTFMEIYSVEDNDYIRKPNAEAYQTLLQNLGFAPESILCFDDSYPNLEVAHGMGLRTALVSNGIVEPPLFWEMHKRETHAAPEFVDLFTFDLTNLLTSLCSREEVEPVHD